VQLEQPCADVGVVLEVAGALGLAARKVGEAASFESGPSRNSPSARAASR
jgi:hypothetical protein